MPTQQANHSIPKKLKILMVATEAGPFVTVGGASSVVKHLSKALSDLKHEVAIFIPKFGSIDEEKFNISMVYEGLKVPTNEESLPYLICNIKKAISETGVPVFFLENQEYYEKRANVYGYSDDPTRWLLLSRGVLEFIKAGIFVPDVLHCNDWHTGAVPNLLKTEYKKDPNILKIATVFTIHNIAYQGLFDHKHVNELDYDDGTSEIASMFSPRLRTQNFMRRGILYADSINTVSKTYSKEILTPEFGEGLDKLLLELRSKLFGIVNGIDYSEFDSTKDTLIDTNYDIRTIQKRDANKKALQKEFDLDIDPRAFLMGFVGRVDIMKGFDLMLRTLKIFLREFPDAQFVQVGAGDGGLTEMLRQLKDQYPKNIGIHPYPNFTLPRMFFAGVDVIIYPSKFEPCGIVQIEAMRYGAVPVVRKVGGLSDTVSNFDSITMKGTGFVFSAFDEYALYGQLVRAYEVFKNKKLWVQLQKNCMKEDFSWGYSAREYVKLYEKAIFFNANPRH